MGILFDIKRFAVHDGPGIRTTVFLKGCPLSCKWCHNPESISPDICTVQKTYRIGAKEFNEPEQVGRQISVSDLMTEIRKEKIFMEESQGGVTFSGGEPMLQHSFLTKILSACKSEGIHTAVDTSGYTSRAVFEKVSPYTDLFLYDLKIINNDLHKTHTGVSNKIILENLEYLFIAGKSVRVRLPMIPDITCTEENIHQTIHYLSTFKDKIIGVDLLPYHNTGMHKYDRFGIKNEFSTSKSMNKSDLIATKTKFEMAGFEVKIGG